MMPITMTLKVLKATVVRGNGPDQISFTVEGPTPFPEMQASHPNENYEPTFLVLTRRGYAEEWLQGMGVDMSEVEIINTSGLV